MLKTELRNQFLKNTTLEARTKYNKQICVSLVKKTQQNYDKNVDLKGISDNKKFWDMGCSKTSVF